MPNQSLRIDPKSPQHKMLVNRISSRIRYAEKKSTDKEAKWQKAEELVLAYIPESEADAARRERRDASGTQSYTTIQLPYTYALLMAAHTYWTSVFFARSPVHQFQGESGESEMQTQALEALINYQVTVGEAMGPYYIWLYDAGKYGVGILGQYWDQEIIHYGQVVQGPDGNLYQATREVKGYEGNRVYNVAPYDFLHDPRVPIGRFQQGEFCAVLRRLSWADILRRERQGFLINKGDIKTHTSVRGSKGSGQLQRPEESDYVWDYYEAGTDVEHPAYMEFWEFFVDLVPSEWGLGDSAYPQKWVFTITQDLQLICGAQPLGYAHGMFPFNVLEPEVEAYGIFNRGIPEIMEPVQQTMDWLINSHFYNVRAALNNQFIMDPSKIIVKDAEDGGPGFIYRLRPEAFGQDIKSFFHQIPVTDVTRSHMSDFQAMLGIGERITGINDQILGVLAQGGRKTATEVRTSTGFGVNRLKTTSEYMSATGFGQHARMLVQSSQQYFSGERKMRIVGDMAQYLGPTFWNVTPEMIAGFYSFVPVDGTMPIDRMAQAGLWKEILGNIRNMPPEVAMGYQWDRMFGWMANLAGLKNISQFKVQVLGPGQEPGKGMVPMGGQGNGLGSRIKFNRDAQNRIAGAVLGDGSSVRFDRDPQTGQISGMQPMPQIGGPGTPNIRS